MLHHSGILACAAAVLAISSGASGALLQFSDPSLPGLSAEAEFTLVNATEISIRLKNTSTGVPMGFDEADQLLTGLSWEFGGGVTITGGSAMTGPNSASVNFSDTNVGPNADVGGEWGYGNGAVSGLLENFISGNASGLTLFGGSNLDGPMNPNGPQAGLISQAMPVALNGLGAIKDEIIVTINLSAPVQDLGFLEETAALIEFGSSAAFIRVPTPGTLSVALVCGLATRRRRRDRRMN